MENQKDISRSEDKKSSAEKVGQRRTIAGVLTGILTFILILMALAAVLLFIGFIALMINPQLETFNSYDNFRFLYEFSPIDLDRSFEVTKFNPALINPEVKLFGSVNFQIVSQRFVALFFFFYFVILGWFINILFQLRNFLGSFERGNSFIRANVKRIRIIGWSVILFPFWGMIYMLSFAPFFKNIVLSPSMSVSFYWRSFLEYGKDSF